MKTTTDLSGERNRIAAAIEHHEKFSKAYFWSPPSNAHGRRSYEDKNTFTVVTEYKGDTYKYSSDVSCSCKNVYYKGTFKLNGKKKDVRLFRRLYNNISTDPTCIVQNVTRTLKPVS